MGQSRVGPRCNQVRIIFATLVWQLFGYFVPRIDWRFSTRRLYLMFPPTGFWETTGPEVGGGLMKAFVVRRWIP